MLPFKANFLLGKLNQAAAQKQQKNGS